MARQTYGTYVQLFDEHGHGRLLHDFPVRVFDGEVAKAVLLRVQHRAHLRRGDNTKRKWVKSTFADAIWTVLEFDACDDIVPICNGYTHRDTQQKWVS